MWCFISLALLFTINFSYSQFPPQNSFNNQNQYQFQLQNQYQPLQNQFQQGINPFQYQNGLNQYQAQVPIQTEYNQNQFQVGNYNSNGNSAITIYPSRDALSHLYQQDQRKTAKDYFFTASVNFDYERVNAYPSSSEIIPIPNLTPLDVNQLNHKPQTARIVAGSDSIVEMYKFIDLYPYEKLSVLIAASSTVIGGGYSISFNHRQGKGTQEESMMSVLDGLFVQNLKCLPNFSLANYFNPNSGRIYYQDHLLENNILFSDNLHLKIRSYFNRDFLINPGNYQHFTDYISDKFIADPNILYIDTSENFNLSAYSVAAVNNKEVRRRRRTRRYYRNLYNRTYSQIVTVLLNALKKGIRNIVVTVPGSGVFSDNDDKYLDRMESATMRAVYNYNQGFNNIVVCGVRFNQRYKYFY